jgi:tRNA G18 (ribose-2'-O)-methylase SpoU
MYEKATMGTHKYENIYRHSTEEFLRYCEGRPLIAFERRLGMVNEDLRYFRYPPNSVLLFGSEKGGVPDVLLERADAVVSIPQFGIHNDMNLSVAVGIVLYDWVSKNVKLA